MADTTNVIKYFPTSSETYVNNLSASISSLATTVPVNSANEYLDGDVVVLVVEPGTTNEAVFTGTKASSPDRFVDCVWTEGNRGVGHASGATVVDYVTATHQSMTSKGILKFANQDGTLKADPIRNALGIVASTGAGWETFPYPITINAGDTLGGREYNLTVANQDVTSIVSKGMRLRIPRIGTVPTQSATFNGSSQYATRSSGSVTGIAFTDDYTAEAWIRVKDIPASSAILSRQNGTYGWIMYIHTDGTLRFWAKSSTGGTDELKAQLPFQYNEWIHIACSIDLSAGTGKMYVNGKSQSLEYTNGTTTSITQAGDLQIGAWNGGNTFNGDIAEVRLWNTIRTEQQILDNMNQQLTGSETNLIGYWKLNGDWNDSTANANHLTPQGGAVFSTKAPFNSIEYAKIIANPEFNGTNTILKVSSGYESVIPNETLGNADYSSQNAPYGLPSDLQAKEANYKMVSLNFNATVGKQPITGIGFKPKAIDIQGMISTSTSQNRQSSGMASYNNGMIAQSSHATFSQGSSATHQSKDDRTLAFLSIDAGGTSRFRGQVISFDEDGITVDVKDAGSFSLDRSYDVLFMG